MILANIVIIALIGFLIWWFWLYNPHSKKTEIVDKVQVMVDKGVYSPGTIRARAEKPLTIEFIRYDESGCADTVVFEDFQRSVKLPLNQTASITLHPQAPGEYAFACPMGMYQGVLVVEKNE